MNDFMHMIQGFEFRNTFWYLILPMILMGIDIATGFINAWIRREISSSKLRSGLGKKVGEVSVLVIGELFTYTLRLPKDTMKFFTAYIILMEIISIIENLDKLGVPMPGRVKKVVNNAYDELKNENDTTTEGIGDSSQALTYTKSKGK